MIRWLVVFVLVLILGGAWLWGSQPVGQPATALAADPAVGRPAPDFSLATLAGDTFTLSAQRGKPVVLNFWATWCQPCQRELPALQQAAERFGDSVVIAAVDQGETAETVQRYVEKLGLTFTVPMDGEQDAAARYNIHGLPTTYFIDAGGVIRSVWVGEMNSIILAEQIAGIVP
jgi:peroxiredoxin